MQEAPTRLEVEELQENLRVVQEPLAHEKPVARQYLVELRGRLDALHAADIAYVLEALPLEERLVVWDLVKADRDGEILLEVSDAVRETLIASMDSEELVAAAETLEADELADIAADLPASVIEEVVQSLPAEERERLRAAQVAGHRFQGDIVAHCHMVEVHQRANRALRIRQRRTQ